MRGLFFIVFFCIVLGLFNIAFNPNKLLIIERINFDKFEHGAFILVDARNQDDFESGHISGALNLNEDGFDVQIGNLLDVWSPEKSVAVYCNPSNCDSSAKIARRLKHDYGIEKVFVLDGDWRKWKK